MKIVLFYESLPPQDLSEDGGAGSYLVTDPPRGHPVGSGGVHRNGKERGSDPLIIPGLSDFHGSGVNRTDSCLFLQSPVNTNYEKTILQLIRIHPGTSPGY